MKDDIVLICFLIQISILAGQFETEYANQLPGWKRRINHGAQHVEKCFYTKLLPDRCYVFHRWVKQGCMHKENIRSLKTSRQVIAIVCEFISKMFKHIG